MLFAPQDREHLEPLPSGIPGLARLVGDGLGGGARHSQARLGPHIDVPSFAFCVHSHYRDREVSFMATVDSVIVHKHFRLDKNKLKRAQEAFGTSTETEAVDLALDFALGEMERNRIVE
jgi:hypothetical protein